MTLVLGIAFVAMLVVVDTASSARGAPTCRVFANIPQPDPEGFAQARLAPWGQVNCSGATTVSVQVCARRAIRAPELTLSKPIWCSRANVRVRSTHRVFARARQHTCARGYVYESYVSLDGLAWDQSPLVPCARHS